MSNIHVPQAIRRQVEAANALEAQMAAASAQQVPATTPLSVLANEPAPEVPTQLAGQQQPVNQAPQNPIDPSAAEWEHKYKTLQGMSQSQLSNMQKQANEAVQERATMARELNDLRDTIAQVQREKASLNPQDAEAFGADMVEMVRRQASIEIGNAVSTALGDMEGRIRALEHSSQGMGQTVAYNAEQQFLSQLGSLVPEYASINKNPKFLEWLTQVDPVYGQTRQSALDSAASVYASERVAAVFNAFKGVTPAKSNQPELSAQVAPGRSSAAPSPTAGTQALVSERDIQTFYNDVAKRKYVGREAEQDRIEAAINQALAEGRVSA